MIFGDDPKTTDVGRRQEFCKCMQANCQNPMKAAASDGDDSDDEEFDEEFDFMLVFACLHSYVKPILYPFLPSSITPCQGGVPGASSTPLVPAGSGSLSDVLA